MILPLAHENLRGRRWPRVTIAIIALNTVVFLATHGSMERQMARTGQVELHILLLSARHPDAPMTPEATEFVEAYKLQHPDVFERLESPNRTEFVDAWDAQLQSNELPVRVANAEMSDLCSQLGQAQAGSVAWNYAFHSVHPFARSYITATFLHGGWLHLIFNMWFLWLAGTVLEDVWGRIIYPVFYLLAGAIAWAVHGAVFPHSLVPALGASGAIAGLMGGFLARFPITRIRVGWVLWVHIVKFYVPAYVILPLWLFIQVFWGVLFRSFNAEGGIAYWAHIGGFAFGALGAFLLRTTGIEQSADKAIEAKVAWTADPLIVRATDCLAENNPEGAIAILRRLVKEKPDSLDGWDLLLKAQQRKQDFEGQKETLAALCRLHVATGEFEAAASDYEWYKNLGGAKLPRGVWLELCKYFEREQRWELAADEYEKLALANSTERAGLSALVSAGRICMTNLHDLERAEKHFKAADVSPVAHSDFEVSIQDGLKQCAATAAQLGRHNS